MEAYYFAQAFNCSMPPNASRASLPRCVIFRFHSSASRTGAATLAGKTKINVESSIAKLCTISAILFCKRVASKVLMQFYRRLTQSLRRQHRRQTQKYSSFSGRLSRCFRPSPFAGERNERGPRDTAPAGLSSIGIGLRAQRSSYVEAVEVHHLVPRRDEVVNELGFRIRTRIDLGQSTQLGV